MLTKTATLWLGGGNKLERLWLLAKIEFKLRYYENKLGLLWALLKPIMDIVIFYVVFKVILKSDVPSFASFLFIGLILWNFFVESTLGTIQLLQTKKYLYEYSNMNKSEIYISTLLSNSIGLLFNFIMFVLFYNIFESESSGFAWTNFWFIILFLNLFVLSLGTSMVLSNLYIIAKDITQIWQVGGSLFFFLSPILYNLKTFSEALPALDFINPMAGIIINARFVMMEGRNPDFLLLGWDLLYAGLVLMLGMYLLRTIGAKAAEKL